MHYWDERIKTNPNHKISDLGSIESGKPDFQARIGSKENGITADVIDYSDKSYAVHFSKRISDDQSEKMMLLGSRYNPNLKVDKKVVKGYVFSKNKFKSEEFLLKALRDVVFEAEIQYEGEFEENVKKEEPFYPFTVFEEDNPKEDKPQEEQDWQKDLKNLIESLGLDFGIDEVKVTKIVKQEIAKIPNAAPQKIVYELPYAVTLPNEQGDVPNFKKIVDDIVLGNNVFLVGGAGTGKTYLSKQIADALGRQMETINCSQWTAPTEIIGGQTLDGYQEGKMIEAFRRGYILLLDEMPKLEPNTAGLFNEAFAKTGDKLVFFNEKDFSETRSILIKIIPEKETDNIINAAKNKEKSADLLYLEIENAVLLSFGVTRANDLTATQKNQYYTKLDELMIQIFKYPIIQNNRKEKFVKHPYFNVIATGNIYPNTTSSAYGANNKQDLSLLDRFAGGVYAIEKNTDLEKRLVGLQWLWSVWDKIRNLIEREKWESQVSIRIMQASLRAYKQEMQRKDNKDDNLNKGKTLKDVIYSFITSGFSAEQTKKMKDVIEWNENIEKYQYRLY